MPVVTPEEFNKLVEKDLQERVETAEKLSARLDVKECTLGELRVLQSLVRHEISKRTES